MEVIQVTKCVRREDLKRTSDSELKETDMKCERNFKRGSEDVFARVEKIVLNYILISEIFRKNFSEFSTARYATILKDVLE